MEKSHNGSGVFLRNIKNNRAMLSKILKKLKAEEEKKSGTPEEKTYQNLSTNNNSGFHAKQDSSTGAARARSIGNRNYKPAKAK